MSMELVKADQGPEQQQVSIPDVLAVLPLPDIVVFPYMIVPLFVNRDRSAKAVDQALSENRMILMVSQKNANVDDPKAEDLHDFGTVSVIMRMLKLPDGRVRILVQGFSRAKVEHFDDSKPYITAKVEPKTEPQVVPDSPELEALIRNVKSSLEKMVSLGKNISPDLVAIATNIDDPARLSDLVASNLDLKIDKAQEVLELMDPVARLRRVHELMAKEIGVLEIQNDINTQARGEMDKSQREFYLRQQMKAIQQELGEGNELQEDIEQYRTKIKKAKMPTEVTEEAERQLGRLERMHPDAAETATLRNYLDWMVSLPWSKSTKDNLDLKKAQKILDEDHYELDKIGADFRGDPSSALLEVLDPEQNFAFRDNYLGVPFDLSNVMFITTANMLDPIQPAFRDRMEIIYLSGYTEEEKIEIAKRHLIPKQTAEHGLKKDQIQFSDEGLRAIINLYTQEAGLRNLEREIAAACRKVAKQVALGEKKTRKIHTDNLDQFLGRPKIFQEELLKRDQVGVATGLAWTPVGGDVLFIEATAMRGRGTLTLTGQLGDVMKESAHAALSYARSHAKELGIHEDFFGKHDIHVHVPEGAIPKDGPSAGVTMATAILSLLTQKAVHRKIAMTGEITLRGEVLPVGGIKEKVLAARRAKIDTIILPALNKRDLEDVNETIRKEMKFVFVDDVKSVFKAALLENEPAKMVRSPRRLRKSAEAIV